MFYSRSLFMLSAAFMLSGVALAAPNDGAHDFSVDGDSALGGVNADIYHTDEDFTNSTAYNVNVLGSGDQVDALSGRHPNHGVGLYDMYYGGFFLNYSIDGDSTIFEEWVGGALAEGSPFNGPGRGHIPVGIHDEADELGLIGQDLDALEAHNHSADGVSIHHNFLGFEGDSTGEYFSTEGGVSDDGDIFHQDQLSGLTSLYLDDEIIAATVGFDASLDQIDALVAFDVLGGAATFDQLSTGILLDDILGSDAVFFSLTTDSGFDPVGDNVYWYSAYNGGSGGLFLDLGLNDNVDALDVHVPTPETIVLLSLGLVGLSAARRRKA